MTSSDKDLEQALMLALVLRGMGYFTEIKVPLEVPTYIETYRRAPSSDVDVLGVRFDADFERDLAIGECKSGEHEALEELLKLQGVRTFLDARKAFFVKGDVHANAREVGRRLRLATLTTSELRHLAEANVHDFSAALDREHEYYVAEEQLAKRLKDGMGQLMKYQKVDYWSRPYHENLNNLIHLARQVVVPGEPPYSDDVARVLLRTSAYICIALLSMARDVLTSGIELPRAVQIFLLGGPQVRRQRERLLDEFRKASPRSKGLPTTVDPDFFGAIVDVTAYLMLTPAHAARVPELFSEISCRAAAGEIDPSLLRAYSDETKKLLKDVCGFLLMAIGVSKPALYLPRVFAI